MLVWFSISPVLLLWILLPFLLRYRQSTLTKRLSPIQQALIVFAHPDDETMFFTPTIQMLQKNNVKVHLLCLSDGNYDGLGRTRTGEFRAVTGALGVNHHEIVQDKELLDGPRTWPIEAVDRVVSDYLSRNPGINALFTFDDYGVSGHPNHISVYRGVAEMKSHGKLATQSVYFLRSVGIMRKYIPPLDFLLSVFETSLIAVNADDPLLSLRTMTLYRSQNVWFRKLFSVFSRYSYVNDYISV